MAKRMGRQALATRVERCQPVRRCHRTLGQAAKRAAVWTLPVVRARRASRGFPQRRAGSSFSSKAKAACSAAKPQSADGAGSGADGGGAGSPCSAASQSGRSDDGGAGGGTGGWEAGAPVCSPLGQSGASSGAAEEGAEGALSFEKQARRLQAFQPVGNFFVVLRGLRQACQQVEGGFGFARRSEDRRWRDGARRRRETGFSGSGENMRGWGIGEVTGSLAAQRHRAASPEGCVRFGGGFLLRRLAGAQRQRALRHMGRSNAPQN